MKGEIHGINCHCCETKSPEATALLEEINSILGSLGPSNIEAPKAAVITKVKELKVKLKPLGDLSPLVKITEAMFSLPDGDLNFEALKLANKNKKIGKFKITDISEHPNLDISKLIDFSKISLSKFKKLKLAFTIPTIDATLGFTLGPVGLNINFKIGLDTLAWFPEFRFDNPIDAIKNLEGLTYKKLLTEAGSTPIGKLNSLAKKQFAGNKPVLDSLDKASSPKEFFALLNLFGLNIVEDIDVAAEAKAMYDTSQELVKLNNTSILPDPETMVARDIGKIKLCPAPPLSTAPYSSDEIAALHDMFCVDHAEPVPVEAPVLEFPDTELPSQESETKKVQDFLASIKICTDEIQRLAKLKMEAETRYWGWFEQKLIHKISLNYFQALRDAGESLNGNLLTVVSQRDSIINEIAVAQSEGGNSQKIAELNASLNENSIQFNAYKIALQDQSLKTYKELRTPLQIEFNPLSNLVGYVNNDELTTVVESSPFLKTDKINKSNTADWILKVAPAVLSRSKELWTLAKQVKTNEITGVSAPLFDYITFTNLPVYDGATIIKPKTGLFETGIWSSFYSAKRIDYFFDYKEQGYNQPKPEYDNTGHLVGTTIKKTVKNGQGIETVVDLPQSANGLKVDSEIAVAFWSTLEDRMKIRVDEVAIGIEKGAVYKNFFNNVIQPEAKAEASYIFALGLKDTNYRDGSLNIFGVNTLSKLRQNAAVMKKYYNLILKEMASVLKEIEDLKKEIASEEECIGDQAKKLNGGGAPAGGGKGSTNLEAECKLTLGSDPVGQKASTGKCPGITKNCYWEEYTKVMQQVSLMPIIELDPQNMAQRLFRYYPVGLQIPVPSPAPVVLPTLAMGIPDIMISIPMPLIWKHIITVSTPLGQIVVWIALAGPIPAPFIMLVDEKSDATFMLTSRGPCSIPHPTVGGLNPLEEVSLLDVILPPDLVKIDMSSGLGKLITGNIKNDTDNPDSGKNVIEKLKERIKTSFDGLEIPDSPMLSGNTPEVKARRKKIKKAFESVPPDAQAIEEGLALFTDMVNAGIDKIKISGIKIPKDDKKLMVPTLGPLEVIDNLTKAIDAAASAPAEIANQVLADLGAGIKMIDLHKKIKELTRQQVETPNVKKFFAELDVKIDKLEAKLSFDVNLDAHDKIVKRVEIVKDVIKKPIEEAASKITPELLGFAAKALDVPPLPFPCYTNIILPPVPPYIYAIIAAFKAAPSIIDSISAEMIADLVSFEINLENALPSAEQLFYNVINGIVSAIPNLVFPDSLSDNMFKQTLDMIKQIPPKFKVRLPKPGLPMQIVIPPELIKSIMKEAAGIAISALTGLIMAKVNEAIQEGNVQKIIAVGLIIKALLGTGLSEIKGADVKAFLNSLLNATVYPALTAVSSIIDAVNALSGPFLSIIELFQFPPKPSIPGNDGPYFEIGSALIKPVLEPLIQAVLPALFNNLPPIVTLLACSSSAARLAFTKLHPTKPIDRIPAWESLSVKNIPFLIWLDYLVATAQRKSGIGSTYLVPYQAIP